MLLALGRQSQAVPWDSMASQISLFSKLQASERPCLKTKWSTIEKDSGILALLAHGHTCPCTLTNTQTYLWTHIHTIKIKESYTFPMQKT